MDEEEDVIPLPNVNSAILKKVNILILITRENKKIEGDTIEIHEVCCFLMLKD